MGDAILIGSVIAALVAARSAMSADRRSRQAWLLERSARREAAIMSGRLRVLEDELREAKAACRQVA